MMRPMPMLNARNISSSSIRPCCCSERKIGPMRRKEGVGSCPAELVTVGGGLPLRHLQEHTPRERIAVGVQSRGCQANQQIAGDNRAAVDDPCLFDHSDDEAGEIVLA